MAEAAGKFLPLECVRSRHQPHHPHSSDGTAGRHHPAGRWRGCGLWYLSALRKQAGSGASGTGTAPASGRLNSRGSITASVAGDF